MDITLTLNDSMHAQLQRMCLERQQDPEDLILEVLALTLVYRTMPTSDRLLSQAMLEGRIVEVDVAQQRFDELVEHLEEGDLVLTVDGDARAVMMTVDGYEALTEGLDVIGDPFMGPQAETVDVKPGIL